MPDTPDPIRTRCGQIIVDPRKQFDPGPVPDEPWRVFIPVLVGDLQTACTYLENACIRIDSATKAGEHFTAREGRIADSLIDTVREVLETLEGQIAEHRSRWLDTA